MRISRPAVAPHWWGPPAGGFLLALAYPPLDLLPLALVAPWPLLAFLETADGARPGRAFLGGYLFGLAHFGLLLYWIAGLSGFSAMAVPAYLASVLVLAANGGLTALMVAVGRERGIPVVLSFPLAWAAIEWLRAFGDLGFTWGVAGDVLAEYPLLIQPAELGGVYLLSLWVMALSASMYRLLRPIPGTQRGRVAAVTVALAAAVPLYGALRMNALERAAEKWPRLRAAAIQPNIPQDVKWDLAFVDDTFARLIRLTRLAERHDPALVVWPESAVPVYLRYDARASELVPRLAAEIGEPIFTGTNDADTLAGREGSVPGDYRVYNAAYLVRADGLAEGRYAKRRLVPVAERVPFVPDVATGFFERLSSWTGQFAPGRGWPTWTVGGYAFGATICYESVFPNVSRTLVRNGADFLVNITNDAWFGPTAAPYQHASHLALRSVEHRVSSLRSANTGISGWVDPLGRYHDRTALYEPAVVVAELPMPGITTLYTRWGDWAPLAALAAWAGLVLVGGRGRRKRSDRAA
ncbi:MAG TPA: apolipoprotein N-acyltransferase [Gemmatimonadota bacterium]|nr:apolipoprotein N-acyltransferase [Gemmatimonadota bacterium]